MDGQKAAHVCDGTSLGWSSEERSTPRAAGRNPGSRSLSEWVAYRLRPFGRNVQRRHICGDRKQVAVAGAGDTTEGTASGLGEGSGAEKGLKVVVTVAQRYKGTETV